MGELTEDKIKNRLKSHLRHDDTIQQENQTQQENTVRVIEHQRIKFADQGELMAYIFKAKDNESFIENAYKAILDRSPDQEGLELYLARLGRGWPKAFVLNGIANSEEAVMKNSGLQMSTIAIYRYLISEKLGAHSTTRVLANTVYKPPTGKAHKGKRRLILSIPVISPVLIWGYSLLMMPLNIRAFLKEDRNTRAELQRSVWELHEENRMLKADIIMMGDRIENGARRLSEENQALKADIIMMGDRIENGARRLSEESQRFSELDKLLSQHYRQLSEQNERLVADHGDLIRSLNDNYSMLAGSIRDSRVISIGNSLILRVEGFIMALPGEDRKMASYLAFYGKLEQGLVEAFKRTVKEGMVVVDVGANIGIYTMLGASMAGKSGRVYSFEPTPGTFQLLKNNIEVNGFSDRVTAYQMAALDKRSTLGLSVHEKDPSMNTLFPEPGDTAIVSVETVSLDEALAMEPRIDVVKIDAEGAESFILRGMEGIIKKNPGLVIFMEMAPVHLRRAGVDIPDFIARMKENGLSIKKVDDMTGEYLAVSTEEMAYCHSMNLVLTRGER